MGAVHCIACSISTARNKFCKSCLVAADFPVLSSIAVFFVRRPHSACHMERAFSLLGHILTHDYLNMSNETWHHLAIMYVNKTRSENVRKGFFAPCGKERTPPPSG